MIPEKDNGFRNAWSGFCRGRFRDLRYAWRVLRKDRGPNAAAILVLALGVGANTAIFTLLDRLLFQPLPVPRPSQLVLVSLSGPSADGSAKVETAETFSYAAYEYLRDHNQECAGLAGQASVIARESQSPESAGKPAEASGVSGNFFTTLGVTPSVGRLLLPEDDARLGASHVAVISDRFWSSRFQRSALAIGGTILFKQIPFTIVGVAPAGFHGIHKASDPDVYIALGSLPEVMAFNPLDGGGFIQIFGRLKAGSSLAAAQSNLQALLQQIVQAGSAFPDTVERQRKHAAEMRVLCSDGMRGYAGTAGEKRRSLNLLAGIVMLLLLVACGNVACLLVARSAFRQHEIGIRLSLGAGRADVLWQSLAESCLLALVGGMAGVLLAQWAERWLVVAFEWNERPIDLTPDARVLGFALAASLSTGIFCGLLPGLQATRWKTVLRRKGTAMGLSSGKALVAIEVAASLILMTGASLFLRSFQNLRSVPKGFSAEHVSVLQIGSTDRSHGRSSLTRQSLELAGSLRRLPGIESAALSDFASFNDASVQMPAVVPGAVSAVSTAPTLLHIDQGYFETLRIPLVLGRSFSAHDDDQASKVAILSEGLASRLFPNQNPIGRTILLGLAIRNPKPENATQVVGVVRDTKFKSLAKPAPEMIYLPSLQGSVFAATVKVELRSGMQPKALAAAVQTRIRNLRLPLKVESAVTLDDEIGTSLLNERIRMQASGLFGGLSLLLICIGIHGLMAYAVARRSREIGIRMAIGATPLAIGWQVWKDTLRIVLAGIVLAIPGLFAAMKAISGFLFGLPSFDFESAAIAALAMMLTALIGSALPALRAACLNPVDALRTE